MIATAKARKAAEKLYDGLCTVTERQKYTRENLSTGFREVVTLENEPCRLSHQTVVSNTALDNAASAVTQVTELIISPDVRIKPGSKITVTQNNESVDYTASGEPAYYSTHQEIILELFEKWA